MILNYHCDHSKVENVLQIMVTPSFRNATLYFIWKREHNGIHLGLSRTVVDGLALNTSYYTLQCTCWHNLKKENDIIVFEISKLKYSGQIAARLPKAFVVSFSKVSFSPLFGHKFRYLHTILRILSGGTNPFLPNVNCVHILAIPYQFGWNLISSV